MQDCDKTLMPEVGSKMPKDFLRETSKYGCSGSETTPDNEHPSLSIDIPKGTLTLRSNRQGYREGVLIHNWLIEEKPKDYNYKRACPRSLSKSTYIRLGSFLDPTPLSVYGLTNEDMLIKKSHPPPTVRHRDVFKNDDKTYLMIEREKEVSLSSDLKYLLPHIREDPAKFRSFTTHLDFYRPPYPHVYTQVKAVEGEGLKEAEEEKMTEFNKACFKKCVSQFTDLNGIKLCGTRTWFDESGIYGNTALRQMHPYFVPKGAPYATRLI